MTKRVLLAGLLGAVAMYVWSFIAHMALPLGEAGVQQIANEQALLTTMQSAIPAHGLYMFPNMSKDQTANMQKIASGPSGLMVYFPRRDFNFGQSLGVEFLTEFAQTLIAAYLLSLTALRTFGSRVAFYALLGAIAAIATNVPYWNWYGFPSTYVAAQMTTVFVGYLCAGLAVASLAGKQPLHAAAKA